MRIANEISLRRLGHDADVPPTAEVIVDGTPSGCVVAGAILESAVSADGRFLLFLTDDVPYEDALSIHLLDDRLHLLDSATLGAAYSTGSFGGLELRPPRMVRFRFIGEADWTVEILPHPAFRLPLLPEATGVSRSFGFSRHFIVRGKPLRESA